MQIVRGSESHGQSSSCIEGQKAFTCLSNVMKSSKMMLFEILQNSYQNLSLGKKFLSRSHMFCILLPISMSSVTVRVLKVFL